MFRKATIGLLASVAVIAAILFCLGFSPADIGRMFAHPVEGGNSDAIERAGTLAPAPASAPRPHHGLGAINLAVIGLYLAAIAAVGIRCGRRIDSTRSFFVADGRMHYVVVGISILGTYLSALTMMGLPGMAYGKHDWTYMVQLPFLVITAVVITSYIVPRYRDAGFVSIYAFFEQRIGSPIRTIAAASFILFAIGRMGLVLYLPALALSTVTGLPLMGCIVVMGLVITLYTMIGGIEAVIWTDAIQVVIFIVAAGISLVFIMGSVGVENFLTMGISHNKFRIIVPDVDVRRITTLWLILETVFQTIRIYATQQDVAQRYLTTPTTAAANRSVWIGIIAYIPLGFIFYFLGTALFAFYATHPDAALPGKADPIYPYFIVRELPVGVAGLTIAAIFAAAMSSIDSAMNSATTVCTEDFIRRFGRRSRTDAQQLADARKLTLFWGLLAIFMAIMFRNIEYVQIFWGKLMGFATNGMLGLLALALLPVRVRARSAVIGFVASYIYLFFMIRSGIVFLLWPVLGNIVCFVVALAWDRVAKPPRAA